MKSLRYRIESWAVRFLFAVFRALPIDAASWAGGFMARAVGPFMGAHRTAKRNLARAFPELSEKERNRIATRMWENLGRVAAELPHMTNPALIQRIETLRGTEYIPEQGKSALFFSGHIGHWELTYPPLFARGVPIALVYRHINNPYVDAIVSSLRAAHSASRTPKGRGAIRLAHAIRRGESLAMLLDQKMNDGIPVPFFGRDAMTAPAAAKLALRYGLPILPVRIVRTKGAHFTWECLPPLAYKKTGDEEKDALAIMTKINAVLESWIREHPEQWFWVHKRWPD